jgi:(p)ppGpp synthase/HD superfamily hydrolase
VQRISKAIQLAVTAHDGQVDKAGMPYILHPLAVMGKVLPIESHQIVGVLHDVIEDTKLTADDLATAGLTSWEILAVQRLSRTPEVSYQNYIESLADSKTFQEGIDIHFMVLDVKIQDLKHNLSRCKSEKFKSLRHRYEAALEILIPKHIELSSRILGGR